MKNIYPDSYCWEAKVNVNSICHINRFPLQIDGSVISDKTYKSLNIDHWCWIGTNILYCVHWIARSLEWVSSYILERYVCKCSWSFMLADGSSWSAYLPHQLKILRWLIPWYCLLFTKVLRSYYLLNYIYCSICKLEDRKNKVRRCL